MFIEADVIIIPMLNTLILISKTKGIRFFLFFLWICAEAWSHLIGWALMSPRSTDVAYIICRIPTILTIVWRIRKYVQIFLFLEEIINAFVEDFPECCGLCFILHVWCMCCCSRLISHSHFISNPIFIYADVSSRCRVKCSSFNHWRGRGKCNWEIYIKWWKYNVCVFSIYHR